MPYVITNPGRIRGIHETWEECKAAVSGVPGARYQKVKDLEEASAILGGGGVVLEQGLYAFTDGNADGGVGVVLAKMGTDPTDLPSLVGEVSTSVKAVFVQATISGLESPGAIEYALERLHNILAELAGLYQALELVPERSAVTVVYDYKGVGEWMLGRWRMEHPIVARVVEACLSLASRKSLRLQFRHQEGHSSSWAGRHDYARLNALADQLAAQGAHAS